MSRPKSIYISPHEVAVKEDDKLATIANVTGAAGEDDLTIILASNLGSTVEKDTVLHESLHHVWHQTELDNLFTDDQEEKVIWSLSPRILALLRENPKFVDWLLEDK